MRNGVASRRANPKLISEDSDGSISLLLAEIYRSVGLLRRSASLRTQSGTPYKVPEASQVCVLHMGNAIMLCLTQRSTPRSGFASPPPPKLLSATLYSLWQRHRLDGKIGTKGT